MFLTSLRSLTSSLNLYNSKKYSFLKNVQGLKTPSLDVLTFFDSLSDCRTSGLYYELEASDSSPGYHSSALRMTFATLS